MAFVSSAPRSPQPQRQTQQGHPPRATLTDHVPRWISGNSASNPLLGLRVLLGVAEAAFFVAGVAALADLAPAERLGEALSYNSLGLYLGITAGPALGD